MLKLLFASLNTGDKRAPAAVAAQASALGVTDTGDAAINMFGQVTLEAGKTYTVVTWGSGQARLPETAVLADGVVLARFRPAGVRLVNATLDGNDMPGAKRQQRPR